MHGRRISGNTCDRGRPHRRVSGGDDGRADGYARAGRSGEQRLRFVLVRPDRRAARQLGGRDEDRAGHGSGQRRVPRGGVCVQCRRADDRRRRRAVYAPDRRGGHGGGGRGARLSFEPARLRRGRSAHEAGRGYRRCRHGQNERRRRLGDGLLGRQRGRMSSLAGRTGQGDSGRRRGRACGPGRRGGAAAAGIGDDRPRQTASPAFRCAVRRAELHAPRVRRAERRVLLVPVALSAHRPARRLGCDYGQPERHRGRHRHGRRSHAPRPSGPARGRP